MNFVENSTVVEILLVEDNLGDIRLTQEALKESMLYNNLSVARDGVEAMAFLRREREFTEAPRPDLILLDLNMPKKDGREVLGEIKGDPSFKKIPVVVLTTSGAEEDIAKSYDLHANCFISKPVDFGEFIGAIKAIGDFWLTLVKLPRETKR